MKELPPGWAWTKLREVVTPGRPKVAPSSFPDLPFIGLEHVEAHTRRLLGTGQARTMKSASIRFQAGDILYGRLRPYLNKVLCPGFDGLCSAEFIVFPPAPAIDSSFLLYFLNSAEFVSFASHLNEGDRPRVDFLQLGEFGFALPPLPEQRRIVAEIEKLFTCLDSGLQAIHCAVERSRILRRTAFRLAIDAARNSDHSAATVGSVALSMQYGTSSKCSVDPAGVPVLRMSNLTSDGKLVLASMKFASAKNRDIAGLMLAPGDLLFNRTNSAELVGKSAVYRGSPTPCSFASYLIRVRLNPNCLPQFLAICLNSDLGRSWVRSVASQQVGQANVSGSKLATFKFPLPSLEVQRSIVEKAESQFLAIDELHAAANYNAARAARLRQAILKKAFEGQLVPQDPNEEPASVLLDRIRATPGTSTPPRPPKARPSRARSKSNSARGAAEVRQHRARRPENNGAVK